MSAITWDDEARCELNCSALYLSKRGGIELGERFLRHVEAAVAQARALPDLARKFCGEAR